MNKKAQIRIWIYEMLGVVVIIPLWLWIIIILLIIGIILGFKLDELIKMVTGN